MDENLEGISRLREVYAGLIDAIEVGKADQASRDSAKVYAGELVKHCFLGNELAKLITSREVDLEAGAVDVLHECQQHLVRAASKAQEFHSIVSDRSKAQEGAPGGP